MFYISGDALNHGMSTHTVRAWDERKRVWNGFGYAPRNCARDLCDPCPQSAAADSISGEGPSRAANDASENEPRFGLMAVPDDGLAGGVSAMISFQGKLVVAGNFTTVDCKMTHHLATWDGKAWSDEWDLDWGVFEEFVVFQGELFAAGNFQRNKGASHILLRLKDRQWLPVEQYW